MARHCPRGAAGAQATPPVRDQAGIVRRIGHDVGMASSGSTQSHAVALERAFPWAGRLEPGELIDFASELETDTKDWSAAAVQQHASLVVSYWQHRAESGAGAPRARLVDDRPGDLT